MFYDEAINIRQYILSHSFSVLAEKTRLRFPSGSSFLGFAGGVM